MNTLLACLLSSSLAAAIIASLTEIFLWKAKKKDKDEDKHDELAYGLSKCQEEVTSLGESLSEITEEMRSYIQESNELHKAVVTSNKLIMTDRITHISKGCIKEGKITLEDRTLLHKMWDEYHISWGGNGDLNALMNNIDELPVEVK